MKMVGFKIFLLALSTLTYCESANILYAIPFTSKSHYISLRTIGLELSRRGHNVTVITAHKEDVHPPNYNQIMIQDIKIWDVLGVERPNIFSLTDMSSEHYHQTILWSGGLALTEAALSSPAVQELFLSDAKFDLVISEHFFQEAFYALAHKYQAPLALVSTYGNCMNHNYLIRNPLQWSSVNYEFLIGENTKGFLGRLNNMYITMYQMFWWKYWYLGKQEELVRKYIPGLQDPVPNLTDLQTDTSLMLLNRHFSFDSAVAYLPNVVEIAGVHITKSNTTLPKDLQQILDNAKHGVVYVNFGSNVRSSELPDHKKQAFLNTFAKLKHTVMWKWEDDELKGQSDNVITRKWFPQKEILNHPNVKVFVSHGGLIGMQEAIHSGVPIIGIPIFGDQLNNVLTLEKHGMGRLLHYRDINEDTLFETISEFVNTDTYNKKAKEVSRRFLDRPMSALDTAVFWLEYVIRNHGAAHMKNSALELNWFAYTMLDIYITLIGTLLLFLLVIGKILNFMQKHSPIRYSTSPKETKIKKKKIH